MDALNCNALPTAVTKVQNSPSVNNVNSLAKLLWRFFHSGDVKLSSKENTPTHFYKYQRFILKHYLYFINLLTENLANSSDELALACFLSLLKFLKLEAEFPITQKRLVKGYPWVLHNQIVHAACFNCDVNTKIRRKFYHYFRNYTDFHHFTLKSVRELLEEGVSDAGVLDFCVRRLLCCDDFNESQFFIEVENIEESTMQSLNKMYSKTVIALTSLDLPSKTKKHFLLSAPIVLQRMTKPQMMIDYLLTCSKLKPTFGCLSLEGIFLLITEYDMEIPQFFSRLYQMLDEELLSLSCRWRYFDLLDRCLHSTYVPQIMTAAFAKKLSTLALTSPDISACIILVSLILNLARMHKIVYEMTNTSSSDDVKRNDSFQFEASLEDVDLSHSSLWELQALKKHHSLEVRKLLKHLETDSFNRSQIEKSIDYKFTSQSLNSSVCMVDSPAPVLSHLSDLCAIKCS